MALAIRNVPMLDGTNAALVPQVSVEVATSLTNRIGGETTWCKRNAPNMTLTAEA